MDLISKRDRIDAIDDQMVQLYVERMNIAREIGEEKSKNNLPIENTLREREVITRVTSTAPEDLKIYTKMFFENMFETSKGYQTRFVKGNSPTLDKIQAALEQGLIAFPECANVACQGVPGAYSQIAADKVFKLANISYFKDWGGVFNAIEKNFCQFGVLPIENSNAGSVNGVYDLMHKNNFFISRAVKLRIQHYLLAKKGADVSKIKEIFSHEQAIAQCSEFLASMPNVKVTIVDNTATAAKMVAESNSLEVACISSRDCAGIYGLGILKANVQGNDNNFTRFIIISKNLQPYEGANKISIMVNTPHEAGALNSILNRFSTLGLNLTKLESRPIENTTFEFAFYFDFEAKITRNEVQNLIGDLENSCELFVFLGSYEEI
ncbi:MAG: prephenate dehydratase domain-containing protein [Bacillota bacterium]